MPSSRLGTGRIVAVLLVGTLAFLVIALVAPWVWQTFRSAGTPVAMTAAPLADLPWQIERRPDGSSRVFGLDLGHGTLQQAATRWPDPGLQLALVRDAQGGFTLEGYLESVRAGFVQGKMVLTGAATPTMLQTWAERATHREPQPSGTWRLTLAPQDQAAALAKPVLQYVAPSEFQRLRAPLLR